MFHSIASRIAAPLALAVVAAGAILGAAPADAASARKTTSDGHQISVVSRITNTLPTAPLDSNPFTKETFFTVDTKAKVSGLDGKVVKATGLLGYQFGYPFAVAQDGVNITMHTPDLKLQGGVVGKISPEVSAGGTGVGVKPGELGAEPGVESTIIPAVDFSFNVGPGKIHDIDVTKVEMTGPVFEVFWDDIHLSVTNAVGPVTVRPYAKIIVTTTTGAYQLTSLGNPRRV